jgi:hypothetical protein
LTSDQPYFPIVSEAPKHDGGSWKSWLINWSMAGSAVDRRAAIVPLDMHGTKVASSKANSGTTFLYIISMVTNNERSSIYIDGMAQRRNSN